MARRDTLEGRNGEIWRLACAGHTQAAIAQQFDISQQRVSQIIDAARGTIPPLDKEKLVQDLTEQLNHLRAEAAELVHRPAPPAFHQGEPLIDPRTGAVVEDHSGRLAALRAVKDVHERLCKMLGLDAATKIEAGGQVKYVIEGVDLGALK